MEMPNSPTRFILSSKLIYLSLPAKDIYSAPALCHIPCWVLAVQSSVQSLPSMQLRIYWKRQILTTCLCKIHKIATVTKTIMKRQMILECLKGDREVGEAFHEETMLQLGTIG